MSEKISLMFSGGIDSTYAAIMLAKEYSSIELITYYNSYGNAHMNRSAKRANELQKKFPSKFRHHQILLDDTLEKISLNSIKEDYKTYKSAFIWCMGCKIAMHTMSIIFNKQYNIELISDGSSGETTEMVEQMPTSIEMIKQFYNNHNITFTPIAYETTREEKIDYLKTNGFFLGIPIGTRFLKRQPTCIPGELYYLPYLLFNKPVQHDPEIINKYISEKLIIADKIIENNNLNI